MIGRQGLSMQSWIRIRKWKYQHIPSGFKFYITSVFLRSEDLKNEVWNNSSYRKLAINILSNIGTTSLLRNPIANANDAVPIRIAQVIVMLENYWGLGLLFNYTPPYCSKKR